jgi:hypothetical protein
MVFTFKDVSEQKCLHNLYYFWTSALRSDVAHSNMSASNEYQPLNDHELCQDWEVTDQFYLKCEKALKSQKEWW